MITRKAEKSQTEFVSNTDQPQFTPAPARPKGAFGGEGDHVLLRRNDDLAVRRAQWLAELAAALQEARALIQQLGADGGRLEAVELYARIEAINAEVQELRRASRSIPLADIKPLWSENIQRGA